MALLVPLSQRTVDMRDGVSVTITKVKLISTSDTIVVPLPASTTNDLSCGRVMPAGSATASVTQPGTKTITIVGTAGDIVYVTSLHKSANSQVES